MLYTLEPSIIPGKTMRMKRVRRVELMGKGVKMEITYSVFGEKS
jgi:hypothetical protein